MFEKLYNAGDHGNDQEMCSFVPGLISDGYTSGRMCAIFGEVNTSRKVMIFAQHPGGVWTPGWHRAWNTEGTLVHVECG